MKKILGITVNEWITIAIASIIIIKVAVYIATHGKK